MTEAFQSWKHPPPKLSSKLGRTLNSLPAKSLLSTRRLDVIVKLRYAKHLIGGMYDRHLDCKDDFEAEQLYRWMIYERSKDRINKGLPTDGWKMNVEDWVSAFVILIESVYENGLLSQHAIPIDKNHQLMNGSHRLAVALAFDIKDVYVYKTNQDAWAPPWGMQWFEDRGIDTETKMQLHQEWNTALGV